MISLGPAQRYFLYREPTDMRKSFDGLCGLVQSGLGRDALSGEVFIFLNRRRTHIKLLVWDRSGFVLYYKRLEQGTFERPSASEREPITWHQLVLMLEGVTARSVHLRKRYALPEKRTIAAGFAAD
jgi:transposase